MRDHTSNAAHLRCLSIPSIIFSIAATIAGIVLPAPVIQGAILLPPDRQCTLSRQLQTSPYREEYIARLATSTEVLLASNTALDSTEQSDGFTLFAIVSNQAETGSAYGNMDAFSKDCLSCHDGGTAQDVDFNYSNRPSQARQKKYTGGKDHPNGMDYMGYVASGRGKFKPVPMNGVTMKFFDGKVGCLTCHNPLNPEKDHLVMSNVRSALCLTCHNL